MEPLPKKLGRNKKLGVLVCCIPAGATVALIMHWGLTYYGVHVPVSFMVAPIVLTLAACFLYLNKTAEGMRAAADKEHQEPQ